MKMKVKPIKAAIDRALGFGSFGNREITADFNGGHISPDGGGVLLREAEKRTNIIQQFCECFIDYRDPRRIEHSVEELIAQRVYALALGYEDLNDHDALRVDPLLALLTGKGDLTGANRIMDRDKGKPLAGKSTLNRLELTPWNADENSRYKKIVAVPAAIDDFFIEVFLHAHNSPPESIVPDVDATDDPLHGAQEGRFFHGYYGNYCCLPLYIFCGEHLLCARLREADTDPAAGTEEEPARIIGRLREVWPDTEIIVRGDSGFCRESIMSWRESRPNVHYVFGLAINDRLRAVVEKEMDAAKAEFEKTGESARVFKDFTYSALNSWSCGRRTVCKAEHLAKGANPRFIATSLPGGRMDARALYEDFYCARGDMENRIKEQQLMLFADRTGTAKMRSNQIRLYFSSVAYVLMCAFRRLGLRDTEMAGAQCDTIRVKLLKIGTQITVTTRKIWLSMTESCPFADIFHRIWKNLQAIPLRC